MSGPLDDPAFRAWLRPIPSGRVDGVPWPAVDIVGRGPDGAELVVALEGRTEALLLVFLSTDCQGCLPFWEELDAVGAKALVLVRETADPEELARRRPGVPIVVGDAAWDAYRVSSYPFLVLVDPVARQVVGESVGFERDDLERLLHS